MRESRKKEFDWMKEGKEGKGGSWGARKRGRVDEPRLLMTKRARRESEGARTRARVDGVLGIKTARGDSEVAE